MLEEGLTKPTFNPAEAALGLLSFVRFELPEGGAPAEERFFRLFTLLNDRLFGIISGPKENFHHEVGGWLSFQSKWSIPASARTRTASSIGHGVKAQAPAIDSDPVVQLLCGKEGLKTKEKLPTLIEAISSEVEHRPGVRFQFAFQGLPKPTQDLMLAMIQATMDNKPIDSTARSNCTRLFGELLRVNPSEQHEMRRFQAAKKNKKQETSRPLALSPVRINSPQQKPTATPNKTKGPEVPHISLSMLEIYLFLFVRYPLAAPKPAATPPPVRGVYHRKSHPYGDTVYLHLFKCYLRHFLNHGKVLTQKEFIGYQPLGREGELFLRIVIELWLCGETKFSPLSKAVTTLQEARRNSGQDVELDLNCAFDIVKTNYLPPVPQVQKSIRSLVIHIMKDSSIALAVSDCQEVSQRARATEQTVAPQLPWCLSPSMTTIQQAFYNFIVTTFRHASIHVTNSPFFTALDTWLMWLEPWNVEMRKRTPAMSDLSPRKAGNMLVNTVASMSNATSNQPLETYPVLVLPKASSRSRYNEKWEPYIAANLHFFTVPLAIFLKRARELDFSSRDFARSYGLVQRVFRVFSPVVTNAINTLLGSGSNHPYNSLVAKHNQQLGAFSPTAIGGSLSLTSLGDDMHNLLEEVHSQYIKKVVERDVFDRIEARIERVFTFVGLMQPTGGEERDIQKLVEQARVIVNLPADYEIAPSEKRGAGRVAGGGLGASGTENPERQDNGLLTERGLNQLLAGKVKCSPVDVAYFGDSMRARPQSHEIAFLVPWTIRLSDWLNMKLLGIEDGPKSAKRSKQFTDEPDSSILPELLEEDVAARKYWFRINLRFLADYRNVLFLWLVWWLWRKLA